MAKIAPLSDVVNLQSESTAVQTINENSDKIEAAFQNTLSRDGSTPNTMGASLDMNSNRILNVGAPQAAGDAVNRDYVDQSLGGLTPELVTDITNLPQMVEDAQQAAADAAQSAIEAAGYVGAAESAPHWTTARTISVGGDVNGISPAWDGSADLSFNLTIVNNAITAAKLASGAVISNLGYTPLSTSGGTLVGDTINGFVPTSSLNANSVGFRGIPVRYQNADWAFILDDCGKMVRHDSVTGHTYSISNTSTTSYPVGFAVMVRNVGAGSVTLSRASGVVLLKDGSGVDANVTVAQWGKATLIHEGSNIWTVGGSGIS